MEKKDLEISLSFILDDAGDSGTIIWEKEWVEEWEEGLAYRCQILGSLRISWKDAEKLLSNKFSS